MNPMVSDHQSIRYLSMEMEWNRGETIGDRSLARSGQLRYGSGFSWSMCINSSGGVERQHDTDREEGYCKDTPKGNVFDFNSVVIIAPGLHGLQDSEQTLHAPNV